MGETSAEEKAWGPNDYQGRRPDQVAGNNGVLALVFALIFLAGVVASLIWVCQTAVKIIQQ